MDKRRAALVRLCRFFYTIQLKKNALPFIIFPENYRIHKGRFV